MIDFLFRHEDGIKLVATLTVIASGLYKYFVKTEVQRRNHEMLTRAVASVAKYNWLEYLQEGVRLVLRAMTLVYGPPREISSDQLTRFLTLRAWRMSAWIASLYLWVFLPAISIVLISGIGFRTRFIFAVIVLLIFLVHLFLLKLVRRPTEVNNSIDRYVDFFRGVAISSAMIFLLVAVLLVLELEFKNVATLDFLRFTELALLLGFGVVTLVRTLTTFGFYAPLVLTLQFVLVAALFGVFFMAVSSGLALAGFGKPVDAQFWTMPKLIAINLAGLFILPFFFLIFLRSEIAKFAPLALFCAAIPGSAFALLAGPMPGYHSLAQIVFVIGPFVVVGLIAPCVALFYGIIFSNSIPDWLSVGLTRFILTRARTQ